MNKRKTLLRAFIEHNTAHKLAGPKKRTLLAVSGGTDSVAMVDLFAKAAYPFAIAHCNFNLRGAESDADEAFVKELAAKYKVQVFITKFDTGKLADEMGISIQLAARQLRYTWFNELLSEHQFNNIATAHHLNDNIETIIYNLTKGTGIRGLRGIPVKQGNIIRPVLFATRQQLEEHLQENNLTYREDSSNASDKYIRNKIRHHVIPLLKEINPALEKTFAEKIGVFIQLEDMYEKQMKATAKTLFIPRKGDVYIPILKLKKTKNVASVLYEYLKDYGFNAEDVEDILEGLNDSKTGKQYLSSTARIIKDRRFLILTQLPETDITYKLITEADAEVLLGNLKLSIQHTTKPDKITADKKTAWLDASKLTFPLIARRWKQGDYFYPYGMKMKKKKLKKFFVDEKLPLNEKENVWVIECDKKIVWVAGMRIDERFKVTDNSTGVVRMVIG